MLSESQDMAMRRGDPREQCVTKLNLKIVQRIVNSYFYTRIALCNDENSEFKQNKQALNMQLSPVDVRNAT